MDDAQPVNSDSETTEKSEKTQLIFGDTLPYDVRKALTKAQKAKPARALAFENEKQRNAAFIQKGLVKPGRISYETLRRAAMSVHVARICINVLKSKIVKTKWVISSVDPLKKVDPKQQKQIENLLKYPNKNDTFRTLTDKILEDLLVLDAVSIEKTRYPNGELAELHFVDSATIRPVYDEHGNTDVLLPLDTVDGEKELPVAYLQILDNSQWGGPESGQIIAAWPKKDMIHFHQHPQGSMEGFGYGLSPLEGVLSVVANLLNADNYNSNYFEEGSFPPIILHLAGQINQRDAAAFQEYMYQELEGSYHRPAFMAGGEKMEVLDLKTDSNRDMQFMEYTMFLAKLMVAAYEMSPQDIGLTDDVNRSTSDTMKELSNQKGYSSILDLIAEIINTEIIWKDFGFEEIQFEWVAPDSVSPEDASTIYDKALRNGTMTINEVRERVGEKPYGEWADKPMVLGQDGYTPIEEQLNEDAQRDTMESQQVKDEKPFQDQDTKDVQAHKLDDKKDIEEQKPVEKMQKSVFTQSGYKTWADDRGYAQPFIYVDVKSGKGTVIKPPVAVNLDSSFELEEQLTTELHNRGLNVYPVVKKSYVEIVNDLRNNPDVLKEFIDYTNMEPTYDSAKWRSKHGGSRRFDFYEVTEYIDGFHLTDPLLIADMKRVPHEYAKAIQDLAALWRVERDMVLGDRRADQYIITHDKRAYGFDYQFKGNEARWERSKDAIQHVLEAVPELHALFQKEISGTEKTRKNWFKNLIMDI